MVLFGGNKDGNNGENYKIKRREQEQKLEGKAPPLKNHLKGGENNTPFLQRRKVERLR
jgi:hypothetical protein